MAPEQLVSSHCTSKADVFSLGTILYEGCAKKRLMSRQLCMYLLRGDVDAMSLHTYVKRALGDIPDDQPLRDLLLEMLRLEESNRPSADEVSRRCAAISTTLPGPSLQQWCQTRAWAMGEAIPSAWIGLELTEREVVDLRSSEGGRH